MKRVHIVNPVAGGRKPNVYTGTEQFYITEHPEHAKSIAMKVLKETPAVEFVVHGGDGVISEVAAGIIESGCSDKAVLSILPKGTGNDLYRMNLKKIVRADAIRYNDRYAVNMINVGFDCTAALKTSRFKAVPFLGGSIAYMFGVIAAFLGKISHEFRIDYIDADNKQHSYEGDCLLALVANGCYCGGGFNAAPSARLDDGLLDLLIVKKTGRLKLISLILDYRRGNHIQKGTDNLIRSFEKIMLYKKCKSVCISGMSALCADGEIIRTKKADIKIKPACINLKKE